jgi:hypothetical protein
MQTHTRIQIQQEHTQDRIARGPHLFALAAAVRSEHAEILEWFLRPENRPEVASIGYSRALVVAAETGRLDLIHTLLCAVGRAFEHLGMLRYYIMSAAARGGHTLLVQTLVGMGVNISGAPDSKYRYGADALGTVKQAASVGNMQMLRYLLDRGAVAHSPDWHRAQIRIPPVIAAAKEGRIEAVQLLLESGAEPLKAMVYAIHHNRLALMRWLAGRYPKLLEQDNWRLGRVAFKRVMRGPKSLEILTLLVEAGVPLNDGYNDPDHIPLIVAKRYESVPLFFIDHLIALGAEEIDREIVTRRPREDRWGVLVSNETRDWTEFYEKRRRRLLDIFRA